MALFGKKKPNRFLGVDIGASSIKIVEFEGRKGRPVLMTYGYAEYSHTDTGSSFFDQPKATGELLARLCKESGVTATSAMTALPTPNVFSGIFSIPNGAVDARERQARVNAEVSKLAPLPLSEMIIQTTFLDETASSKQKDAPTQAKEKPSSEHSKQFRAMVTGSAKTFIQKYLDIFSAAKLSLQAIDTEALALIRALIGKDKGAIMILDIGSTRTNLIIVEKGIPFVSRSIQLGGNVVTQALMKQLSLSEEDADRVKHDFGAQTTAAPSTTEGLPPAFEVLAQPLLNEIRFAFQLYANMELVQIKQVEKIILTGGSSHLPYLSQHLAQALNLNVYRGDPWARVTYPKELETVLEEIGPRMSVAIGLAMREVD